MHIMEAAVKIFEAAGATVAEPSCIIRYLGLRLSTAATDPSFSLEFGYVESTEAYRPTPC